MTQVEQIAMLKRIQDEKDSEILATYLSLAGDKILSVAYPYRDDVTDIPRKYHSLQVEIATYMLNKRGGEGQTYHNENGIERGYGSDDIPTELLRKIIPEVGVL